MTQPGPLDQPLPDLAHEALRVAVVTALADVTTRAAQFTAAVQAINVRIDALEIDYRTLLANMDDQQEKTTELTERVENLEAPDVPDVTGALADE